MCLYPRLILNKHYLPTKKNNYNPPVCDDYRKKFVAIGCGNCIECRKRKARDWQIRLLEEIKVSNNAKFVTLTFNEESLYKLIGKTKNVECNATATHAVRLFLERVRKKTGKSIPHLLITELGHTGTERIHLHGILFTNLSNNDIDKLWGYGFVYIGEYCNEKTIAYITKYITKVDIDHKGYRPIILCSRGIGAAYTRRAQFTKHRFNEEQTKDFYIMPNGTRVANPIYFRNKLYSEQEREILWTYLLDKQIRYVMGQEIDIKTEQGYKEYECVRNTWQKINDKMQYGNDTQEWQRVNYNITMRMLNAK